VASAFTSRRIEMNERRNTGREGEKKTLLFSSPSLHVLIFLFVSLCSCATVRPQERAILADPSMQFDGEPKHQAQLAHAIDNREGSMGGTGVSGGGCGCN
jgi:hypothetical protein